MDKESLKNIINNSDTIYNEHLKLQARRRLREEIRRQLKEIELEQPKDTLTKDLIEDEIVESIKLPPFLLQEIEKCFGIDISVGATTETNASKGNRDPTQEQSTEQTESQAMRSATDLMERLKVAEQFRMMAAKKCRNKQPSEKPKCPSLQSKSAKTSDSIPKPNPQRKESESSAPAPGQQQQQSQKESIPVETVNPLSIKQEIQTPSKNTQKSSGIIVVVSSEDEDNEEGEHITVKKKKKQIVANESDNDSDHSNSSSWSTDSTKRRYRQKLESDANNIVDSFEKLILPQLKESVAERYRSSHCDKLRNRLHFISCVVTSSEHNSQSFSKAEVAKIQQNLKSNDYRQAIEFLLREIVNVVNLQKQTAMARRKQNLEKALPNELIATTAAAKNAEPASESHQREAAGPAVAAAAATAQAVMPPTPPRNGTPTPTTVASAVRPLHTLPTGLPYMGLDSTVAHLSPGSFSPNDSIMLMGDSVTHGLLEIDRRLLENQNRRGFLEEMIMKFQREKSDLEMLSLELQNRKFLLLNTVISRNQTATMPPLTTVTPTISPLLPLPTTNPAPATDVAAPAVAPAKSEASPRKRKCRAVVVKRVKILPKRRRLVKRSTEPTPSHAADKKVAPKETETEPEPNIPQPMALQLNIKQEPIEAPKTPPPSTQSNPTVIGNSPQYQHLTASVSASLAQQTMAVVPPLPPPPPPPLPFANMSQYDLPRALLKPTAPVPTPCSAESQMAANLESYNYDYIPTGRLHNISCPITQIRVYKAYIIAASENGDIFLFNIGTHKLEFQITKHSEAITNMYLCEKESFLYTTSLDGFFKKSSLENLERVMQTVYLKEPLQSIDIEWGVAFIGSRWGNIFTYNIAANKVMDLPLLSTGQSVIAIKATKEGPRNIIILGCKGNVVLLHDAATGLLLRRLSMPDGLNVYSLMLLDGHLFCGTQKNEVFKFDFATGLVTNTFPCGNGAVTMALYKENYLLIGCYDGYVYVLNKETGLQLGRFAGPGRLVLALALAGDKAITSSKDNALEILQIPPELFAYDQSTLE
ncbi:uncharacterized protein LOC108659811 [Drosophila navojoa]|nr:uncharacterized protein LOC108659811 [Drosophila navojoa]